LNMEGRQIDLRVSCMPTLYGENVVLRLLEVSNALLTFTQLGFSKEILDKYEKLILRPYGIILVTGPTGSGKTTTLYSSLTKINTVDKNIITLEGLRSVLRQDPDVIMVGEIRDLETARMAIQAALTGHLVLSTLHTNDAPGAITRMIDMKVEPFLVASSVIGIVAQRLVRTLCKDCKEPYDPSPAVLQDIGLEKADTGFYRGKGCPKCLNTGYKGRISLFELMVPDPKIRQLTVAKASLTEIKKHAQSLGMKSLKEDGIKRIREGLTTVEEVLRVTESE